MLANESEFERQFDAATDALAVELDEYAAEVPDHRGRSHAGVPARGTSQATAWACTAVRATVATMSSAEQPRERSLQGRARPWRTA